MSTDILLDCPVPLRPINFIELHSFGTRQADVSFAEFVCGDFDMSQYAVSMAIMEDRTLLFIGFNDALKCLDEGGMAMLSGSFGGTTDSQMRRIEKYLLRGFKWKAAHP
jgi:hypothetical protein